MQRIALYNLIYYFSLAVSGQFFWVFTVMIAFTLNLITAHWPLQTTGAMEFTEEWLSKAADKGLSIDFILS